MSDSKSARIPALDLLRFTAAIAVTLYHFVSCYPKGADANIPVVSAISAVTRYGYLGVDLFFMISGFVIVWSSWNRNALDFTVSRITRLYPSFWASILFTVACIWLIAPFVPHVSVPVLTPRTLAANATMIPAVLNAPLIEGVYWTLEIEIRFYALIFLLLLFRSLHRIEPLLYAWLALTIVSLFVELPWILYYTGMVPYGAFFASGCLFFLVMSRGWSIARSVGLVVGLMTSMAVSINQRGQFLTADSASAVVVPTLVAVFFGLFVLMIRRGTTRPARTSYWLGALTYPLYLTHAMMGLLVFEWLRPTIGTIASIATITVLALIVAIILTVTVDIPARKPFAKLLYRIADALKLRTGSKETASPSSPR